MPMGLLPNGFGHFSWRCALHPAHRPGIPGQLCVAGEKRDPFGQRLCDQQPVEGVGWRGKQSMLTVWWLVMGGSI